jgi:hypothetical protein
MAAAGGGHPTEPALPCSGEETGRERSGAEGDEEAPGGGEGGERRGWRGRVAASGLGLFSSVCLEKEAGDGGDGDACRPWPLQLCCAGRLPGSVVDNS